MWIGKDTLTEACRAGLLAPEQVEPLQRYLAERGRFNFVKLGYYLGALLVMGAFTLFMVQAWEAYSGLPLFALSVAYIAGLGAAGWRLWRQPQTQVPGGLLVTAAVCIVPLAVYAALRATGLWADDAPGSYRDFHRWINGGWMWMELATLAAGGVALWRVRFPFLVAPLAWVLWYVSMDLTPIVYGESFARADRYTVSVVFGLGMLAVAYGADRAWRRDFAFWLYLFGLLAFWGGLSAMESDSEWSKAAYCGVNLLLLAVGVLLQRRVFLVFGGIGVLAYLGHLAWRVFEDFLLFPIALSALGLLTVYVALLAQRHRERIAAWRERMLPSGLRSWLPPAR